MTEKDFIKLADKHLFALEIPRNAFGGTKLKVFGIEKLYKQLLLHDVSKSVAKKYAEFCVECDRKGLPLLLLDDYIEQYCC